MNTIKSYETESVAELLQVVEEIGMDFKYSGKVQIVALIL